MVDPALPGQAQDLGSAFCREPGYVLMRSGFDTPDETVLPSAAASRDITAGTIAAPSISLATAFRSRSALNLGLDPRPRNLVEPIGRNRTTTSHSSEPSNCRPILVHSKGVFYQRHGRLSRHGLRPSGKQVRESGRRIQVDRHVLLAKQPDYVVVWDQCTSPMPSKYFLHTTASKIEWDKNKITSHTDYGADLDVQVLLPKVPLVPNEKEGPFGSWFYADPPRGKEVPIPF